jgi:hypothetical protein
MSTREQNLLGLFTRQETRRGRIARVAGKRHKSIRHRVKGALRKKIAELRGIPLSKDLLTGKGASSRRPAHRTTAPARGTRPASAVRSDVIQALRGQGYNAGTAKKMAEGVRADDTFESAFRRVISKNPAELVIFGNPSMIYSRANVIKANRAGNPIPAALVTAFESAAGSKLFDTVTSGKKKRNVSVPEQHRRKIAAQDRRMPKQIRDVMRTPRKKKNPEGASTDRATQLFETFHHREAGGVFERQRSARVRKDYTILGPLVAIGINAEQFDEGERRAGKKRWADHVVENYDKLPRMDFMTPGQVAEVKHMLGDPGKYVKEAPLLASSPNGRQLYALAQVDLDLKQFDTDAQKDLVDLGDATFVVYIAKKPSEVREWVHILGEDGGTRPRLMYDRLRKEVCFIGGSYVVKGPGIMH